MFKRLIHAADTADRALQARFGRPYHLLLAVGLSIEIGRRIIEIPEHLGVVHRLIGVLAVLVMEGALLLHQIGALAHHLPHRLKGPEEEAAAGGSSPCPARNGQA